MVEPSRTASQEQRSSLFLSKPFCSTLAGIRRYHALSHAVIKAKVEAFPTLDLVRAPL